MKKWKEKFIYSSFDRKMTLIMRAAIIFTAALVLLFSSVSSIQSMKRQSLELLQSQNSTVKENLYSSLESYKTLAIATILDRSIQQYAKRGYITGMNVNSEEQTDYAINGDVNAFNILDSINNMYRNLNFIALVKPKIGEYLFAGKEAITSTRFMQNYQKDEQSSKPARASSLKMNFSNAYFSGTKYAWNIYFPIYDSERIFSQYGLLCISFSDPVLMQILDAGNNGRSEIYVIDTEGMTVASGNTDEMGQYVDYRDKIKDTTGNFIQNGRMYIYQKVTDWNFYVVSSVPTMELYEASIRTCLAMTLILVLVAIICTRILRHIIQTAYRPLDKVVRKMDDVASGSLGTRINAENMGEDFAKLALGFNSMMEEILILMEQVKLEQHQIEQIRFNALQSQIQPHFLYNTLECIHWQAIADGNQEISTLVKALAKYYRICLSKGQDIIPLHMELDHIRNYLIIQNMRYDNIIESIFEIEEDITDMMLPKLTLQPLVENSIYHGMKIKEGKKGILFVSAKREGENIRIQVSDTGTGMEQDKIDEMNQLLSQYDDSFGYSVRNVNKRIELLYGKEYGLHYLKNESGGVTVEILLPYDTEAKESILSGEGNNV